MFYFVDTEKKFFDTVEEALDAIKGLVRAFTEMNSWSEGRYGFNILNMQEGYAVSVVEGMAQVGFISVAV